jgi:parallel beta-helix repeat protein
LAVVTKITQIKANNGNVTSGDAPGFPVTISRSGRYLLTTNLTVPNANTTAIEITVDNVTLDLNGFTISNSGTLEPGTGIGVSVNDTNRVNTTVVSGTVQHMGSHGIHLGHLARVERTQVIGNFGYGIDVGSNSTVSSNIANGNGDDGIKVGESSIVTGNTVRFNGDGIDVLPGSSVTNNVATDNSRVGILTECPVVVIGNMASNNEALDIVYGGENTCRPVNNIP